MGRKLLAALTAFALLLSMCSTALADSTKQADGVRETNFFASQPHADLNFSDMEYKSIDAKAVLADMDALRDLLNDDGNAAAVEELFYALTDRYMEAKTMYSLAEIQSCQDAADEKAAQQLEDAYSAYLTIADALPLLIRDVLQSPCGAFLNTQLSEAETEYYLTYQPASYKSLAMSKQETALENEYRQAAVQPYTAEYFGREWDMQSLNQAYFKEKSIDKDTYIEICRMIAQVENDALGGLYLRLVQLRKSIAAAYGYSHYGDFVYKRIYGRDYTRKDIEAFHEAVKEYIAPLNSALAALSPRENDVYYADYSGSAALDMIEPYIGNMSSELLESFSYMRDHHLYDSEISETKPDTGFTVMLYSYGAPFLFNAPANELFDFTAMVHEFGHYNNAYWQPVGWHTVSKSLDVMEVHSQAMELLLSHYYPDIFKEDADAVLDYQISSLVGAICEGAYYDELQQFVFGTSNVTLEQINQEARRLSIEYGFAEEDSPTADVCGLNWVQVSHNFTSPFYYISYAVSAAGAFAFWLDAQLDYFSAVDSYLAFTALDASCDFQDCFAKLGMPSPLSPGYLKELALTLQQELEVEERLEALTDGTVFPDVPPDSWYASSVLLLTDLGCISGYKDGAFHPGDTASWGTAMGALLALTGQKPELEDGKNISRQEFCQLIAEVLDIPAAKGASPFTDTQDSSVTALAELGVISGYDGGTFRPDGELTRAELCVILCRAAVAVSLIHLPDENAGEETDSQIETDDAKNLYLSG